MRAPRFPLQLSVSYRPLGHSEWRQGRTENISASGVLVQDSFPVQVDTCVEFKLALASKPTNGSNGEVACRGRVVRVLAPPEREPAAFAIAIDQYDFNPLTAGEKSKRPD